MSVCRPPMDDDARVAAALYGGRPRRPARHTCVNDLGQKWISRFTVASPSPASGSLGVATVSWRLGRAVWEGLEASRPVAIVARRAGGCPATPGDDDGRTGTPPDRRDAVVGRQRYRVAASVADLGPAAGLPAGSYC